MDDEFYLRGCRHLYRIAALPHPRGRFRAVEPEARRPRHLEEVEEDDRVVSIRRIPLTRWMVAFLPFLSVCLPASVAGQPSGDPLGSVPPCDLVAHGSDYRYDNRYADLPDAPLSHGEGLPVEFRVHDEFPPSHRPVIHAAAAELNMRVGFRMIAIRGEIDRGDLHRRRNDGRNVIYWDDYWASSRGID